MPWTEEQWHAARAAYESARFAAERSATALNMLDDAGRLQIAEAAGPSGQAAVRAASALSAEFPEEENARTQRTAATLLRNAITFNNRFRQVDGRILGAREAGRVEENTFQLLLNAGWREAKNELAPIRWTRLASLPGVRPREQAPTLTSQSDPQPEQPSSSEPSAEQASAESPTQTPATRRRRRRTRGFGRINPWPIAIALGLWFFTRR